MCFQNDPVFGETIAPLFRELYKGRFDKTYIRNLNNDRTFSETSSTTPHQDVGEIWGGAFWEMRKLFGQDITDRLLFSTWREMQGQEDTSLSDYGMSFVEKLQVVSQSMGAGNRTGEIKSLFQDRMLGS
jgi:hypothetical protein